MEVCFATVHTEPYFLESSLTVHSCLQNTSPVDQQPAHNQMLQLFRASPSACLSTPLPWQLDEAVFSDSPANSNMFTLARLSGEVVSYFPVILYDYYFFSISLPFLVRDITLIFMFSFFYQ